MTRFFALLAGLAVGIVTAGLAVGLLLPQLPDPWRSERLVWGGSLACIGASLVVAFVVSRPRGS